MEDELRAAVSDAAGRGEVARSVMEVYAELADAIEIRRPICKTSGRCCRFEEFGHRLYVSTMELATFMADWRATEGDIGRASPAENRDGGQCPPYMDQNRSAGRHTLPLFPTPSLAALDNPGCPFQVDGLCGVHGIRPFGCRIFFCDETSTGWQHEMYERLHGRLRKLHEDLQVPYFYVEWRFALRVIMPLTLLRE
jgi:Fe-S-cluster containining protein